MVRSNTAPTRKHSSNSNLRVSNIYVWKKLISNIVTRLEHTSFDHTCHEHTRCKHTSFKHTSYENTALIGFSSVSEIESFIIWHEDGKIVYIAPLKALVSERISDWKVRIEQKLNKKVSCFRTVFLYHCWKSQTVRPWQVFIEARLMFTVFVSMI